MTAALTPYQRDFIDFLVVSGSLTFGEFVTKSGRKTPYFINTGNFDDGSKIERLSSFYAAHIRSTFGERIDIIFGPAYKGIPLAVSTTLALYREHGLNVGFSFDRKEAKEHGDRGKLVGRLLKSGDRVVIVEDVVTAGTTLQEIVPALRKLAAVEIAGVVICVDRCERGRGALAAVKELEVELDLKISPIVTIHQILSHLSQPNNSGFRISSELQGRIENYLREYAA